MIATYVKITNGTANVWIQNSSDCGTATATYAQECTTNEWPKQWEAEGYSDDEADDPEEERAREPQPLPAKPSVRWRIGRRHRSARAPMHRLAWNTPPPVLVAGTPP